MKLDLLNYRYSTRIAMETYLEKNDYYTFSGNKEAYGSDETKYYITYKLNSILQVFLTVVYKKDDNTIYSIIFDKID